jgi:hypothetical protein
MSRNRAYKRTNVNQLDMEGKHSRNTWISVRETGLSVKFVQSHLDTDEGLV